MNRPPNLPIRAPQSEIRQLGVRELIAVVIRRRWIIAAVAAPIIVAAAYGTFTTTDTVTASGRVVIETRDVEALTFRTGTINYDVIMSTSAQVAMSIPVATKAAESLMDTLILFQQAFPEFVALQKINDVRDVLSGGLDCHQVGESNILQISFSHVNPYFAIVAANALMDAYIEYNIESKQNIPAIGYYTDQIDQVRAEIDSMLSIQADVLSEAGYAAFEDNARATSSQIAQLERSYFSIRSDRMAMESRVSYMLQAVAEDPEFMPLSHEGDNWNLIELKKRLDSQMTDLYKLRIQYTADSEWVTRQKKLIADTKEQLVLERNNYFKYLEIEVRQLQVKEYELQRAIQKQKEYLQAFPQVKRKVDAVEMAIDTRMDLLEGLQIKRGEVRLKAGTDQRISNIVPLNRPSVHMAVAGSKKVLYVMLAVLFGLALGFLAAFFVENQDHRLYEKRQIQQYLEVPVLGSITQARSRSD